MNDRRSRPGAHSTRTRQWERLKRGRNRDDSAEDPRSKIQDLETKSQDAERSGLLNEIRTHPLATLGAIAAILALIPAAIAGFNHFFSESLLVQISPVEFRKGQSDLATSVIVPTELAGIQRPPEDRNSFLEWAERNQAIYANQMEVSFLARSEAAEPTLIVDARVHVVRRETPSRGTWIVPDGAGEAPERVLYANLDKSPPEVTTDGSWAFPLRVSDTDIEAFTVVAQAEECHCYWTIELDYLDPRGKLQTFVVDDNGKPFEVTGVGNATAKTSRHEL